MNLIIASTYVIVLLFSSSLHSREEGELLEQLGSPRKIKKIISIWVLAKLLIQVLGFYTLLH